MGNRGLIYFKDGKVVAESNDVKVYQMNDELFLEIGPSHTLWALESEIKDYIQQLGDLPNGQCLEIGLGLGVVSRYILTFPRVQQLTTIEINPDVIEAHFRIPEDSRGAKFPYEPEKHKILCADGIEYAYQTKKKYDFIFIDCYDRIDEDTLPLIADMHRACLRILKPGGKIVAWLDKYTPGEHFLEFQRVFNEE